VIGALQFVLEDDLINGPVNFVAPNPVTNAEFTKTLGKVLSRPTIFPIPAFGVRLAFGEMADALLLASQRVAPKALQEHGYEFQHWQLAEALQHVLA
jgi:NAD dependent epimerase/dehydratase family enzyme